MAAGGLYPPCCQGYARQAVAVARFVNCRNNSSIRPWVRAERKGAMAGLADELQAGIDEAARKMAEARLAGDDYGAGACRRRGRGRTAVTLRADTRKESE